MKFKADIIKIFCFFLIITATPVIIFFSKKQNFSETENRILTSFPHFTAQGYFSREYMNNLSNYLSDHFVMREKIISFKNNIERLALKNEINGVLNVNGNLVEIFRQPNQNIKKNNINTINNFIKRHNNTVFCLAPTAQHYFKDKLPCYSYADSEEEYINSCYKNLDGANFSNISASLQDGEYLYYRSDHHWTSNGAFNAYQSISDKLGITPYSRNNFTVSSKSKDFYGTLYSKTFDNSVKKDEIIKYELKEKNPEINITDEKGNVINQSLYYPSQLLQKDKYSYFLGANKGVININNFKNKDAPNLLIIKDSYANSLIPFLSLHYSKITLIDLRYTTPTQLKKINPNDFSKTLILYNVIGFSKEKTVSKLKFIV